jgi:hypothetical protein
MTLAIPPRKNTLESLLPSQLNTRPTGGRSSCIHHDPNSTSGHKTLAVRSESHVPANEDEVETRVVRSFDVAQRGIALHRRALVPWVDRDARSRMGRARAVSAGA